MDFCRRGHCVLWFCLGGTALLAIVVESKLQFVYWERGVLASFAIKSEIMSETVTEKFNNWLIS